MLLGHAFISDGRAVPANVAMTDSVGTLLLSTSLAQRYMETTPAAENTCRIAVGLKPMSRPRTRPLQQLGEEGRRS